MKLGEQDLADLIRPNDKATPDQVIECFRELARCKDRVKDPLDDIETIFRKIQQWKEQFGDLDQQEKAVSMKLRNDPS